MGQPSLYSKFKASLEYSEASLKKNQKGNLGLENGLVVENVDCSCREPLSSIPNTHVGWLAPSCSSSSRGIQHIWPTQTTAHM